ncbi:MAG: hypothetical protein QOI61_1139 [Actinomycetota bacterium]
MFGYGVSLPLWVRAGLVVVVASAFSPAAAHASGDLRIEVLSNRADVISGGDALVQVVRPPDASGAAFTVKVGDRDVTGKFGKDGVGLIEGLANGANAVTATLDDGRDARITITNHPIGGPVFAGKQLLPWICKPEAKDAQCNRPRVVSYQYKSATDGTFSAYDPKNPPAASSIATTKTDQGKEVPYIVRLEDGVMDRGSYAIAVLDAPGAWNRKLLTAFGPNTAPHYSQPAATPVMDDMALSRGFMVANNGLQIHGENTNDVVSTESFMMLKEHIVEAYGRIRYTMAEGCSGGSYQLMDEAMYPGLLDGLQPNCTFVDLWTTAFDVFDCGLIVHYFSGAAPGGAPLGAWAPAIDGHKEPSDCAAWDATFYNYSDPTNAGHCNLDASLVYNPDTNPGGVRCTIADYMSSIFGPRPKSRWTEPEKKIGHGFANIPWGNEGVQYGLVAVRSGQITPEEFVDLNQKIGGMTVDGKPQAARTVVDENTASIAYRGGAVMDAQWVEDVPIVDLRAYNESGEIHTTGNSVKLRARLDRANGHHDNQITWTWNNTVPIVGVGPPADIELKSFELVDKWLSRIEADKRDIPKARKVVLDKPLNAVDACFVSTTGPAAPGTPSPPSSHQQINDPGQCSSLYPSYSLTRPAAGAPATDDVVQCALSPVDPEDYLPATLSDAQLDALRAIFPNGVCDYRKRAVGQQDSIPWMTYEDGPGGKPLGAAPQSVASSPAVTVSRTCDSTRKLKLRIRARKGTRVKSITVYVGGRKVKTVRGARKSVPLNVRAGKSGKVRVLVVIKAVRKGHRVTLRSRHTYRVCSS